MSGEIGGGIAYLRFPVRSGRGRMALLEKDQIFYVEAEADDSLIRTARKKLYRHSERLDEVEARLPSPPFSRVHRSSIVNLNRVLELRSRGGDEWELKIDPPVNKVLPVSRRRLPDLREVLGI